MNIPMMRQWIGMLRSGEFTQVRGLLKSEEGNCCLGVLCELYRLETGYGEWDRSGVEVVLGEPNRNAYAFMTSINERRTSLPPMIVREWAGLKLARSGYPPARRDEENDRDIVVVLAEMNDKEKLNFNQIAEYLEAVVNAYEREQAA